MAFPASYMCFALHDVVSEELEKKIIHESFRFKVFTGAEIKQCPTHFNVFRPHGVAPNVPCRHVVTETTVLI